MIKVILTSIFALIYANSHSLATTFSGVSGVLTVETIGSGTSFQTDLGPPTLINFPFMVQDGSDFIVSLNTLQGSIGEAIFDIQDSGDLQVLFPRRTTDEIFDEVFGWVITISLDTRFELASIDLIGNFLDGTPSASLQNGDIVFRIDARPIFISGSNSLVGSRLDIQAGTLIQVPIESNMTIIPVPASILLLLTGVLSFKYRRSGRAVG